MKTTILGGVVLGLLLALPGPASAQSLADAQLSDLETMHEKFASLADAFPEDTYDWRPMEGVRSVKEVIALIAAECNLFPGYLGMEAPEGIAEGFGAEMERLTAMSRAELLAEDPEQREARFNELVAQAYEIGKATEAAAHLEIDAVIDPADTRKAVIQALSRAV